MYNYIYIYEEIFSASTHCLFISNQGPNGAPFSKHPKQRAFSKKRDVVIDHQDDHDALHHLHGHPKIDPAAAERDAFVARKAKRHIDADWHIVST